MNPDLLEPLFGALAILILPFWVLVVFLPSWGVTRRVVRSLWSVVPIACAYTALVVPQLAVVLPLLFSPDPLGQAAYFSTPGGATSLSLPTRFPSTSSSAGGSTSTDTTLSHRG